MHPVAASNPQQSVRPNLVMLLFAGWKFDMINRWIRLLKHAALEDDVDDIMAGPPTPCNAISTDSLCNFAGLHLLQSLERDRDQSKLV
eukprot:1532853-Amphidinium_carterae.1